MPPLPTRLSSLLTRTESHGTVTLTLGLREPSGSIRGHEFCYLESLEQTHPRELEEAISQHFSKILAAHAPALSESLSRFPD